MPKKCSSFKNKSTSSKNKKRYEDEQDSYFINKGISLCEGYAFCLVGSVYGYRRHYNRLCDLGFPAQRIVFIERDPGTAESLRRYKRKHKFKNQVIEGELTQVILAFTRRGKKISYVEADGVDAWGELDIKLYKFMEQLNIPFMLINGSARTQSETFKNLAKTLGCRRTKDPNNKDRPPRLDTKRIIKRLSEELLPPTYEFHVDTYGGRKGAPMYTTTVANLTYTN